MASTEATTHPRPHVSVIVAAYSVEPFLRQCLDSIAAQTLHDIEVICVNDGSPDNSLAIMEEFASRDERFQVVDKPNGGYGSAVNAGLSRAKGEYISIVEPDDFIDKHMLEDLYGFATFQSDTPADVVKGSYREYYDAMDGIGDSLVTPEHDYSMPLQPVSFTIEEHPVLLCMHPSVWSAIYRRSFLEEHGIRLVEAPGSGW
ncbi:MAG: glycosyltransferase family 2 protein, partial [Eggerthellaceae bacterium]|nr:glycosyltransferase family 2 protein [Eggerthellaceae bacterium]